MSDLDSADCIYQLSFAKLERAAKGKVSERPMPFDLVFAALPLRTQTSDYRLPLEQALYRMEASLTPQDKRDAGYLLADAIRLLKATPSHELVSIANEELYIRSIQGKLATLKPRPWFVRMFAGQR